MRPLILALALTATAAGPGRAAQSAWVEMTAAGPEARVVTDAPACPTISIGGRRRATTLRAGPNSAFANRVCAALLPAARGRVTVGELDLPTAKARPGRLVIFGDTGCRLTAKVTQHCNDPSGWPFARVAALAAARRPDLVIHVGDYYYREKPCPGGQPACAGSPYGDKWATWKAELFDPARSLLAAAPWVFTRGNHETCPRGGAGWFRLLDAAPQPKPCSAVADTFAVDIGAARLFIIDSSDTDDKAAPADRVAAFSARLAGLNHQNRREPAWIVTHRPFWYAARKGKSLTDGGVNATERAAARNADLAGVELVLSGHKHDFTSLDFGRARPPQLIVGTGGDVLEKGDLPPPVTGAARVDGLPAQVFNMGRFGYFLFDRRGDEWVGGFHDLSDALIARCRLGARSLRCVPAQ
jgi:hypothetical protein